MNIFLKFRHFRQINLLLVFLCLLGFQQVHATRIKGKVFTERSIILPFASILVKGTTTGTTANSEGEFYLDLAPGNYTLICQHVGYEKREREIKVGLETIEFNFVLREERLSLEEIIIKPGGEDPAYEIIRNAIKKRPFYKQQVAAYQCNVYIKGLIQIKKISKNVFRTANRF